MAVTPVVRFENVSKRFQIHHERARSFQDLLISGFRRSTTSEEFWALRDVSFVAEPGASLGIIGANGSGKSTLLKLLTRILTPTAGRISVVGRVSALLELGAGFHPELSGRDNVFLNASILGLPRREVAARFDAIVRFSGLERFIDIPVKHYSSGMYARLGFAVAINVDPDILLIDEVLAVGDEGFQEQCLETIRRFHEAGKTLILVSHDVSSIANICTDCLWLEEGRIRGHGAPRMVVADYQAAAHRARERQVAHAAADGLLPERRDVPDRWGSHEAEIVEVALLDANGYPSEIFETGDSLSVHIRYRTHEPIQRPVFGVGIDTADGVHVAGPNTRVDGQPIDVIDGHGYVEYAIPQLPLLPGEYRVSVSIYDDSCTHAYDYHDRRYAFRVVPGGPGPRYGLIQLAARWAIGSEDRRAPAFSIESPPVSGPPPVGGRERSDLGAAGVGPGVTP